MARPSGPKTRCSGTWTEAKFKSFIKNNLRQASRKWGPLHHAKKKQHLRRGFYLCEGCDNEAPATIKDGRKRVANVFVDHINPIIDPDVGFTTWDDCIERMFCETDNLQVLCKSCHDIKTKDENDRAKERRARSKQD